MRRVGSQLLHAGWGERARRARTSASSWSRSHSATLPEPHGANGKKWNVEYIHNGDTQLRSAPRNLKKSVWAWGWLEGMVLRTPHTVTQSTNIR